MKTVGRVLLLSRGLFSLEVEDERRRPQGTDENVVDLEVDAVCA